MRKEVMLTLLLATLLVAALDDIPTPPSTPPQFGGSGSGSSDTGSSDERELSQGDTRGSGSDTIDDTSVEIRTDSSASGGFPWLMIVGAVLLLAALGVGGALLYRHLQHGRLGLDGSSSGSFPDLPLPKPTAPAPQASTQEVDLDKLKHACAYVERLRRMGVDEQSIRHQLSQAGHWPESYVRIALQK